MKVYHIFSLLLLTLTIRAEVFIGPTSLTNRLVINTNEAIVISALVGVERSFNGKEVFYAEVAFQNQTNFTAFELAGNLPAPALAGPAELFFNRPVAISYRRIQGAAIRSAWVTADAPHTIQIGTNQTVRVLGPVDEDLQLTVKKGDAAVTGTIKRDFEFSGPLTLDFAVLVVPGEQHVGIVSYYFTEDFLVVPETDLIQGPTGSFEITVEKSADLTNWQPTVVHSTSTDQKAFYRLKISK